MLGDLIYEATGKRTARRVLSVEASSFKVEVTFEESSKLLGAEATGFGTYWSGNRPDGTLYGEGQGVVLTKKGELATWKGAGAGQIKAGGAVSYRGAIYFYTASKKMARLNKVAGVFEYEVDANGTTRTKVWEWK